ncbi:MAG: DUF5667 domain-containing protein [Patescibacteria group bacterium]
MNNLKKAAQELRLSAGEKTAMRARIFGLPAHAPVQSQYFSFSFQFLQTRVLAPLAIVLLVGSGTAYAAEGSLPGGVLYPVKIYVNEELAVSLTRSPEAKAEVHATIAERRLGEAQELAARGELDATTTEALALNLEAHVEAAEVEAEKAEATDAGKSRQVRAKLAAALDANARVLARLGKDKSEATKENSEGLAGRLIAREGRGSARSLAKSVPAVDTSVQAVSLAVGTENSTTDGDPVKVKAAASLEHEASEELAEAHEIFNEAKSSLSSTTVVEIEKQFSSAETSMSLGSASLGAGSYVQAEEDFMDALRLAIKLQRLLEAEIRFDRDLIAPLFDDGDNEHDEDKGKGKVEGAKIEVKVRGGGSIKVLE